MQIQKQLKSMGTTSPTFKVVVDTREQNAYHFSHIKPYAPWVVYKALPTGDYSIEGYEDRICIERKSLSDLFGSTGHGRERLQNEFERMRQFEYAAIVIEAGLDTIFKHPPSFSKPNRSKSVFRTLLVWSIRYKVFVWPCPDRAFAERLTYLLLEKFYKEATEKI
jgi:DNA excision repair protein ERCC-4